MLYNVKTFIDVNEDDYNEGEIRQANWYSESGEFIADNKIEAVAMMMDKLYYSFNSEMMDEDFDGNIIYSVLVDEDNSEASKNEIEAWKLGKKTLYSANIMFNIYEMKQV